MVAQAVFMEGDGGGLRRGEELEPWRLLYWSSFHLHPSKHIRTQIAGRYLDQTQKELKVKLSISDTYPDILELAEMIVNSFLGAWKTWLGFSSPPSLPSPPTPPSLPSFLPIPLSPSSLCIYLVKEVDRLIHTKMSVIVCNLPHECLPFKRRHQGKRSKYTNKWMEWLSL